MAACKKTRLLAAFLDSSAPTYAPYIYIYEKRTRVTPLRRTYAPVTFCQMCFPFFEGHAATGFPERVFRRERCGERHHGS